LTHSVAGSGAGLYGEHGWSPQISPNKRTEMSLEVSP
jgi:hypothetical protein